MSVAEAQLRVAWLVAGADGVQAASEAGQIGAWGATHLEPADRARLDLEARADVAASTPEELLARIAQALPGLPDRVEALRVAVRVAGADRKLALREATVLAQVRDGLGLRERDVRRIVQELPR